MKLQSYQVFALSMLATFFMGFQAIQGAERPPLPAFIPNAPDTTKAVASYTALDVFSCVAIAELPKVHPIKEILTEGPLKLKAEWPGAKDGMQIDAMLNLVLDATTPANKEDAKKALQNVRFILYHIMDLSDTAKADAVVRVAGQQTDPLKKRLVAEMAYGLFKDLYDPRLLQYIVEYVDDPEEIVFPPRAEGKGPQTVSVGAFIWGSMIQTLLELGFEREALPPAIEDDAQSKSDFMAWMPAHMAEATQKCNAYKTIPGFWVQPPKRMCWSARP